MSAKPMDVLAELTNAVYVADTEGASVEDAYAAIEIVRELIEADAEYDLAFDNWERLTLINDINSFGIANAQEVADRFEAATMRRIDALARCKGGKL